MDEQTFLEAMRGPRTPPDLGAVSERFDFAFRESKDLHVAMAAVNEILVQPITYEQLADLVAGLKI